MATASLRRRGRGVLHAAAGTTQAACLGALACTACTVAPTAMSTIGSVVAIRQALVVLLRDSISMSQLGNVLGLQTLPHDASRSAGSGRALTGAKKFCLMLLSALKIPRAPRCLCRTLAGIGGARLLLPVVLPSTWRALRYWRKVTPILFKYWTTWLRARRLRSSGNAALGDAVWAAQHRKGAQELRSVLVDLQGFYLKLGQVLAAKTDLLPTVYTEALSTLLDDMPSEDVAHIERSIRRDLGEPVSTAFAQFDWDPVASATVAQVHRARMHDGRHVAVKVQHRWARRMMTSDLVQLRLLTTMLKVARVDLGFDIHSIVKEYCVTVPLEFDFEHEARMAQRAIACINDAARSDATLHDLIIPKPLLDISSRRVLTMDFIRGVPILHLRHLPLAQREHLGRVLVKAYGHMILGDGVFHSDPHPGNLLAVGGKDGRVQLALLDFGQGKMMTVPMRLLYAQLVIAMATGDSDVILRFMRKAGIRVENCSEAFQVAACQIMFDTRMDFPEARMSPADAEAVEFRTANVKHLPQELFMIMRVITLLRGVLSSLEVDVHAAELWAPLAAAELRRAEADVQMTSVEWLLRNAPKGKDALKGP